MGDGDDVLASINRLRAEEGLPPLTDEQYVDLLTPPVDPGVEAERTARRRKQAVDREARKVRQPLPCPICDHPRRAAIEADRLAGLGIRPIHWKYGVAFPSVRKHDAHMGYSPPRRGRPPKGAVQKVCAEG